MTRAADSVTPAAHPFFLEGSKGRLFAVHHLPQPGVPVRGQVLILAPFNEEMNRCRSMVTLQARAWATLGVGSLVVDLHGTGDSDGDHADARWSVWQDDAQRALQWLVQQPGGVVGLLGIRLGAILAAQVQVRVPQVPLMLWQPVADGKMHLTQFLRVRMAAALDRPDLPKETTASMRQQWAAGECVEVAGYALHPDLARALDELRLADSAPSTQAPVLWLENAAVDQQDLTPASQKVLQAWREQGVSVEAQTFAGPAFWQVHERAVAPQLIELSSQWLLARLANTVAHVQPTLQSVPVNPGPTSAQETACAFTCGQDALVGVLHQPAASATPSKRGVLFVVGGGPQYRVGGHRQLTLWARRLCADGYPAMRFDYRGMGDAHGDFVGFEAVSNDIKAAVDHFMAQTPGLNEVVLWGECDASSAILFYAHRDPRVKGVVLLNPWVRTEAGEAKAILRFYYLQRLLEPSFWKKVLSLRFNPFASLSSAFKLVQKTRAAQAPAASAVADSGLGAAGLTHGSLPDRLLDGLSRFQGPVMLVLSGRDLIAREFEQLLSDSPAWQAQMKAKAVTRHDLAEGDHTFSSALLRQQVVDWGRAWLRSW